MSMNDFEKQLAILESKRAIRNHTFVQIYFLFSLALLATTLLVLMPIALDFYEPFKVCLGFIWFALMVFVSCIGVDVTRGIR